MMRLVRLAEADEACGRDEPGEYSEADEAGGMMRLWEGWTDKANEVTEASGDDEDDGMAMHACQTDKACGDDETVGGGGLVKLMRVMRSLRIRENEG